MFQKPFQFTQRNPIGGKERKKLRSQILSEFPQCKESDLESLLPAKEQLVLAKIQHSRCTVYLSQNTPIFIDLDGKGDILPTIYSLWRAPRMIRCFVIHSEVSRFIVGGADLMLPGVLIPESGFATQRLEMGKKWGIRVLQSEFPFAVGRTLTSALSIESSGMRGKGLECLHTFGDFLWQAGPKSVPDVGFTVSIIKCSQKPYEDEEYQSYIKESMDCKLKKTETNGAPPCKELEKESQSRSDADNAGIAAPKPLSELDVLAHARTRAIKRAEIRKQREAAAGRKPAVRTIRPARRKQVDRDGWANSSDEETDDDGLDDELVDDWEMKLQEEGEGVNSSDAERVDNKDQQTAGFVEEGQKTELQVEVEEGQKTELQVEVEEGQKTELEDEAERDATEASENDVGAELQQLTVDQVDSLLQACLLESLKVSVLDTQLPLDASAVFARAMSAAPYVLHNPSVMNEFQEKYQLGREVISSLLQNIPATAIIDVQKSPHRKALKFIAWASKSKWIESKECRGVRTVTRINRQHPRYVGYKPVPPDIVKRVDKEIEARMKIAADKSVEAGSGAGGSTSVRLSSSATQKPVVQGPVVFVYYRLINKCRSILMAVPDSPSPEIYLSQKQATDILNKYVEQMLAEPTCVNSSSDTVIQSSPECVVLDKTLCNALNQSDGTVLTRAQLVNVYFEKLDVSHSIVKADADLNLAPPKIVKGRVKPIEISEGVRHGKNYVTTVTGQGNFFIDAKVLAETLSKKMAASSTTFDVQVARNVLPQVGVTVQGKVGRNVYDVLVEDFGINKKSIQLKLTKK